MKLTAEGLMLMSAEANNMLLIKLKWTYVQPKQLLDGVYICCMWFMCCVLLHISRPCWYWIKFLIDWPCVHVCVWILWCMDRQSLLCSASTQCCMDLVPLQLTDHVHVPYLRTIRNGLSFLWWDSVQVIGCESFCMVSRHGNHWNTLKFIILVFLGCSVWNGSVCEYAQKEVFFKVFIVMFFCLHVLQINLYIYVHFMHLCAK